MDKTGLITNSKGNIRNLAVDGLIFGVLSGLGMYLVMTVLVLFSRNSVTTLLERFSTGAMTSPLQGLLSHLAVSAIYGMLFGALIWPILQRFSQQKLMGWLGGLGYGLLLLFLAQVAILPATTSNLAQLPLWEWALGHISYGLILGALFARENA